MKMLRKNDSRYQIEPVGASLGMWVGTKIEKDIDLTRRQPNSPSQAIKLPTQTFLVSITNIVSCGDNFTPVVLA